MAYFQISDYFKNLNKNKLESFEINRAEKIKDDINSFQTVAKQVEYIEARRQQNKNRMFDEQVFGISFNSVLDPNKYSEAAIKGQQNTNWSGQDPAKIGQAASSLAAAKSFAIAAFKPALIILIIFILINIGVYVAGLFGGMGETPFTFCKDGESIHHSNVSIDEGTKVKDGYKLPVDYKIAGEGYNGQGWDGEDSKRGKGVFASEDFRFDGTDEYSKEHYAIASRWEYVSYSVKENMWPGHDAYGNGTSDGVDTSKPYKNMDRDYYNWILDQKIIVRNPENGKAVVVQVGNADDDPNWGGSPLNTVAGVTYKAQEALGFKAGGLDGGDYNTNIRDSGIEMEMWWTNEDAELGPIDGVEITTEDGNNACSNVNAVGGGNSSIADAAVSMAHESIDKATPNSGPNNGKGTDLYVQVHDAVLPNDPWYQSCDRAVATAVRWAGADDSIPAGNTGTILNYMKDSDKWERVTAKEQDDLKPGDVMVKSGHIIVYAGHEAVQKKYPDSQGVLVHASIGGASSPASQSRVTNNRGPAVGNWYKFGFEENGGEFETFRNVETEKDSEYKNIGL